MTNFLIPRGIATTATSSGALTAGRHTPVDATSGNRTMTLPTPPTAGAYLSVEKVDATANTVTISGSIRGSASTITLTSQYQSVTFVWSGTTWRPTEGHVTFNAINSAIDGKITTQAASDAGTYLPRWKPNTAYTSGQYVVNPSGQIVEANTTFTSGSSYSSTNWTAVTIGGSYTQVTVDGVYVPTFDVDTTPVTATNVPFTPTAYVSQTNVQTALAAVGQTAASAAAGGVSPAIVVPPASVIATPSQTAFTSANSVYFTRFSLPASRSYRYVNLNVNLSSGHMQVGVVQLTGTNFLTYTRVMNSGVIVTPAATDLHLDLGATTLPGGDYALFVWSDNTTTQFRTTTATAVIAGRLSSETVISGGVPSSGSLSNWNSSRYVGMLTLEASS